MAKQNSAFTAISYRLQYWLYALAMKVEASNYNTYDHCWNVTLRFNGTHIRVHQLPLVHFVRIETNMWILLCLGQLQYLNHNYFEFFSISKSTNAVRSCSILGMSVAMHVSYVYKFFILFKIERIFLLNIFYERTFSNETINFPPYGAY